MGSGGKETNAQYEGEREAGKLEQQGFKEAIATIKDYAGLSEEQAKKYLDLALNKAQSGDNSALQFLSQQIPQATQAIQTGISQSTGAIQQSLSGAQQFLSQGIGQARGDISRGTRQQLGSIQQGIGQQTGAIQGGSQQAQRQLLAGLGGARQDINQGYGQAIGGYNPYAQAGQTGLQRYTGLLTGQTDVYQDPIFQRNKQLTDQMMASQGLTGSGTGAMENYSPLIADLYARQLGGYQNLMNQGLNATGAQSGLYANQANQLAGINQLAGQGTSGLTSQEMQLLANIYGTGAGQQADIYGNQGTGLASLSAQGGQQLAGNEIGAGQNLANLYTGGGQNLAGIYGNYGQQGAGIYQQGGQNQSSLLGNYGLYLSGMTSDLGTSLGQTQIGQSSAAATNKRAKSTLKNQAFGWGPAAMGIAGGIAGAFMGGPAGAMQGFQLGQGLSGQGSSYMNPSSFGLGSSWGNPFQQEQMLQGYAQPSRMGLGQIQL